MDTTLIDRQTNLAKKLTGDQLGSKQLYEILLNVTKAMHEKGASLQDYKTYLSNKTVDRGLGFAELRTKRTHAGLAEMVERTFNGTLFYVPTENAVYLKPETKK